MTDDLVTITSGALTARINPLGAELWSIRDQAGREWMTNADPAFWSGHAPLLFPIIGSLAGDRFRYRGRTYDLPRHGFARRSRFDVVAAGADHAHLRLIDNAETRAVYPFAFGLDLDFAVAGTTLTVTATVTNPGADALPFSFGYHPAFAWPLPGGADKAAHKLVFADDEPGAVRRVGKTDGLMLPDPEPGPVRGRELPLSADLFAADAIIWTDLASRAVAYGADDGAWLDLTFPDTPMLGLWQVPGARYICIEPWQGHADPVGFTGELPEKPGIVVLPPGEHRSFRLGVTVRAG